MATQKTQTTQEIQAAAQLVLDQEEERKLAAARRAKKLRRRREKEQAAAVTQMRESIETMKVCIIAITSIMFLGIVISIWVLSALSTKVHEVQEELDRVRPRAEEIVQQVETIVGQVKDGINEVERVRDALRNPLQTLGSTFGAELDAKLNKLIGERVNGSQ